MSLACLGPASRGGGIGVVESGVTLSPLADAVVVDQPLQCIPNVVVVEVDLEELVEVLLQHLDLNTSAPLGKLGDDGLTPLLDVVEKRNLPLLRIG